MKSINISSQIYRGMGNGCRRPVKVGVWMTYMKSPYGFYTIVVPNVGEIWDGCQGCFPALNNFLKVSVFFNLFLRHNLVNYR